VTACRWCGIVASPMALVPVWDAWVQMFIDHYVCARCEERAWAAYQKAMSEVKV